MIATAPKLEAVTPQASASAPACSSAPPREWVEVVEERSALVKHQASWDILAAQAVEPNVFYEPWLFLPAARFFEREQPLRCVFIFRRAERGQQPILCGFFPFALVRRFRGLPFRMLRLWEPACVLSTPLIHRDWTRATLRLLFDWVASERCPLVELPRIHGEGPFQQALVDVLNERRLLTFVQESYTRPLIRRGADALSYCAAAQSRERRRKWRRLRRRLGEQGKLETRVLEPGGDVDCWLDQFLRLEASGWKGRAQTAMASIESSRAIFRAAGRNGHALGKLQMLGLFLDEEPIALSCNYLSGGGGYTFKIAYDERFAKYSPGVQLELDNIEELHRRPDLQWLDSSTTPGHSLLSRLWKERRTMQSLLVATSRWFGNSVVGLLPCLRSLNCAITP